MTKQQTIEKRTLGKTQTDVTVVGLGTWQLGGTEWGNITEDDAVAMLHRAAELGVNLFDTADVYGGGRSEKLIGRFLKETDKQIHVATKLGRRGDGDNGGAANYTLDAVRRHTQDSLDRLGVDQLFLTQWHCIPTDVMRDGEVFEHLETVKKEGLIANWGVSVESVEEGLLCMEHPGCASLQVIFNIFRQKIATDLLPVAKKKGVGILARVPLASGLLAGKFKAGHQFDEKDHRNWNANGEVFNAGETFAGLPFEKGVELAGKVAAIVGEDHPLAQAALRWIIDHDAVTTVIPGATKMSQVESNVAAAHISPIDEATHEQLRALYNSEIASQIRGKY